MKLSFIFVLLLFIVASCTEDTPTIVTPLTPPHGVTLIAINGNNSVQLVWNHSTSLLAKKTYTSPLHDEHDGHESVPAGILVYRGTQTTGLIKAVNHIATLPSTATDFTDSSVMNENVYYYALVYAERDHEGTIRYSLPTNIAVAAPYDYSSVSHIDYTEHVQRIFTSSCAYGGCHAYGPNDETSGHEYMLAKTAHEDGPEFFNLSSWEYAMKGGSHGATIIPYSAAKSHLINHLNTDTTLGAVSSPHMPFNGYNLPADQIQLLRQWVNEGAQNDVGAVALSVYSEGKVMVTNQAEDLVSIVDLKTKLVSRYIQAGVANVFSHPPKAPHNLTLDQPNNFYYVNLITGGEVLKFSLSDNALLGQVTGINSPTQIAITATGDTGFSAQFAQNTNAIRFFNTRTMSLYGQTISSPYLNKPHGVQFTPDYSELWVTGNLSDNMMVVTMSDLSTSIIPLIPNDTLSPGSGGRLLPYQTIMTSNGRYVYVSCQKTINEQGEVRVIDRDSMKVTKIITVGKWPLIIDKSPDDQFVYTANRNSNNVSVIRTSDNTVTTIENVGPQPHGIKISADGKYAYVSCENVSAEVPPHHPTAGSKIPGYLSIIDLTTNTVIKQIEIGAFAAGVVVVE